ncbi:type II toxin-antitoxin system CcdA family antitoxin [Variovorax sp. DT-64]|uniref:type II toxin-antitoxin system CcdA family antitoxin n=1 Tax=Variovorax sp. DT-64 TaxID=3396160 RepID=UPI003F1E05C9
MIRFDNAPKKATNLSLNSKVLEMARELGMNVSQTVDSLLAEEVKRRYWEKWAEENKEAMEAYNARIAKEGLPLAKYRTFARSLGDGKKG